MKKISKALALSLSALLLLAGCNNDDSTDLVEDETELTDNSGNGADGSSTKPTGGNSGGNSSSSNGGNTAPTEYAVLPIIPMGVTETRVDGAGIMINLDNSELKISGGNSSSIKPTVTITDTKSGTNITPNSVAFDDYGPNESTVRLYVVLPDAHFDVKVEVKMTVNGKAYAGEATFVDKVYVYDYVAESISVSNLILDFGATGTMVVTGTPFNKNVTEDCTWTISNNGTGSTIDAETGLITAGKVEGTETVTAIYADGLSAEGTLTVQKLETEELVFTTGTKIEGAGITLCWSNTLSDVPSKDAVAISVEFDGGSDYKAYEEQLTKSYSPVWVNANSLHFTVPAGFPNNSKEKEYDYKHKVTVKFTSGSTVYTGTANFLANTFVTE